MTSSHLLTRVSRAIRDELRKDLDTVPPILIGRSDRYAQAALEEIKFEQLVGALEGLLGALGANRPEEELVTDFGMLGLDNINRTQALLSELEKPE